MIFRIPDLGGGRLLSDFFWWRKPTGESRSSSSCFNKNHLVATPRKKLGGFHDEHLPIVNSGRIFGLNKYTNEDLSVTICESPHFPNLSSTSSLHREGQVSFLGEGHSSCRRLDVQSEVSTSWWAETTRIFVGRKYVKHGPVLAFWYMCTFRNQPI